MFVIRRAFNRVISTFRFLRRDISPTLQIHIFR